MKLKRTKPSVYNLMLEIYDGKKIEKGTKIEMRFDGLNVNLAV